MGTRAPPVPMDSASENLWSDRGRDPRDLETLVGRILSYIHDVLLDLPASRHAPGLSAFLPHDDLYRLSLLPDTHLRNIICRLPVTDAVHTTALSRRWRGAWHSTPLILIDSDLLPAGTSDADSVAQADARRVTSAVSRILAALPGPFRCVHLTTSYTEEFRGLLARWLQLLAVKGVQELVLTNRPWPLDLDLPATFFGMATLTRLYLGLWKFPDTADLPRAASFPNLRELGFCDVLMENRHMDFILARSPMLEILCLQGNFLMDRLTLFGHSLRCTQMIMASDLEITVEDALHLEHLIIWSAMSTTGKGSCRRIKIGRAPTLTILGYLEPKVHTLQAGTREDPSTMLPSVKILGLKVCFGIRKEAKMLPCILRCFPNVEMLHIESKKTAETIGKLSLKFWEECGATECIRSHIKLMVFQKFRGDRSELCFLKFFLKRARMLTELVILYGKGHFTSMAEANSRLKPLHETKPAVNCCSLLLFESAFAENKHLHERHCLGSLADIFWRLVGVIGSISMIAFKCSSQ